MPSSARREMTAKEYLKQYEYAMKKAARYRAVYEDELHKIDAVRSLSDNDGMPHGSGISKPTENKAIRLADKALRWQQAELDAIEVKNEVFSVICEVNDIEGDVLYERYINLRKWEEICVHLHYSWNGIHKAHKRALAIVEGILNGV